MQIIGLCRFSYRAMGSFQVEHDSVEERSAFLYQTKRMEERFRHFETIMLPSIAAQTEGDFTFVIVIGDNLPDIYQERLFDLCAPIPQIVIQAHAPADHRETMQKAFNAVRVKSDNPVCNFAMMMTMRLVKLSLNTSSKQHRTVSRFWRATSSSRLIIPEGSWCAPVPKDCYLKRRFIRIGVLHWAWLSHRIFANAS